MPELCWYHYKYVPVKARKCHGKPCPMFSCLNESKKRVSWLATVTSRKPFSSSNLVFVKDSLSDMEFLIDSGSTVSIIPLSYVDNEKPASSRNLFALNLTEVKTYGKRNLPIDIGLSQKEMK